MRISSDAGHLDTEETYYLHWLAAIERLMTSKGVATDHDLRRHRIAWHHAAHRTAHGSAIELKREDFEEQDDDPARTIIP